MKLKFEVKADVIEETLAAFQYREWAEEWRNKMCATGIIVEDVTPQRESEPVSGPITGGDRSDELIPMETDGGGTILVEPSEHPTFPRDGYLS